MRVESDVARCICCFCSICGPDPQLLGLEERLLCAYGLTGFHESELSRVGWAHDWCMLSLQEGLAVNGVHEHQQGAADNAQNQPATAGFQYDQASGEAHLQLCSHDIEEQLRWPCSTPPFLLENPPAIWELCFMQPLNPARRAMAKATRQCPMTAQEPGGAAISACMPTDTSRPRRVYRHLRPLLHCIKLQQVCCLPLFQAASPLTRL